MNTEQKNNGFYIITKILAVCILFSVSVKLYAQDKEADISALQKANELRKQAYKLKENNAEEAEKLYEKANAIYPCSVYYYYGTSYSYLIPSMDYLLDIKKERGDIRGANKIWQSLIDKAKSSNPDIILLQNVKLIGATYEYVSIKKEGLFQLYLDRANFNLQDGDVIAGLHDLDTLISLGLKYNTWQADYLNNILMTAQNAAFINQQKDILKKINAVFADGHNKVFATLGKILVSILDKNYKEAIELGLIMENNGGLINKLNAKYALAIAYAFDKQPEKSEEYITSMQKSAFISKKDLSGIRAINSLYSGKYEEVLVYLNEILRVSSGGGKSFYYTIRAMAYEELEQYDKARRDYETALLYNSEFEEALNGLAKLEGKIVQERKTDTTAPQITISEPSNTRGIQITAPGSDVLIRGIVADPSGVKAVSINGQQVFLQKSGLFWGNVILKEGLNKITISATDIPGNVGEVTFEIEKPAGSVGFNNNIVSVESKNYALIIAAQNYDDPTIPSLENPVADAIKLKLILKNSYSFSEENISTLFNPTTTDFKQQFAQLQEVIQPEDNLIIFYAGHGVWVEKEKAGYWLLTDAKRNDINTWLSNKLVLDMIANVSSRHTLLITDACFSGSVFKTRGLDPTAPVALREMSDKITRVAITSGNDTEVPDESVFMKYLIKALSDNKEKYLTAQKMFINDIIEAVMTESKTEPRYGTLELAGHVGGDYIFVRK